ncbi:MAG: MBL fold metallo-hydrolase [Verrucomicrobiota bacterium]
MPVLLALACLLVSFVRPNLAAEEPAMFAHFIDVGQAQAILLEFPCGAVLIDAGTQNGDATKLISYLNHFFARRADLDRTLQALFITHAHVDHTTGLDEIATNYTVLNYIDNGLRAKRGGIEPRRFLEGIQSGAYPRTFPRPVTNEQIEDLDGPTGITDSHMVTRCRVPAAILSSISRRLRERRILVGEQAISQTTTITAS